LFLLLLPEERIGVGFQIFALHTHKTAGASLRKLVWSLRGF
jgi:hypothetical protein